VDTAKEYNLSLLIRAKAFELGFDLCGITEVKVLSENGRILEKWCEAGMNSGMHYLQRNIEKRINPGLLVPGAKSLVVTGFGYYSGIKQKDPEAPLLSRYAYGLDYHNVITSKLKMLLEFIRIYRPDCIGSVFCDSGPLLEKAWAREAGLGWQGRNSLIINPQIGSFFFIGALVLDIKLDYDKPFSGDYCGSCTACIDSCPTGAINDNHTIDARKCIANLTIENRGSIPEDLIPELGGRLYGCDTCQEVCPWNDPEKCRSHQEFMINDEIAEMTCEEWLSLKEERYLRLFPDTAVGRVKYPELMRNIRAAVKSKDHH